MAEYCGTRAAVGCASGSDALLLALMISEVGRGDEVLLPSFTFFATAGAVWRLGATPVFVDIDPMTFNIDPAELEAKITPATKAILPVHLFGQCADMTAIGEVARAHDLVVIEDAAQAIGAEHQGRRSGGLGTLGCFSFYPSKNLGGFGDGGLLTTDDEDVADALRNLRNHGQHPLYHHHTVGVNSRLDSLQAAVLRVKLVRLETWTAMRQANARRYAELFTEAGLDSVIGLPAETTTGRHVWNQYTVRVTDGRRDALQAHLASCQVGSAIYYPVPLHLQECFASLGYVEGSLPKTETAAGEVLSLPIFPELEAAEQRTVVERIASFYAGRATNAA